MDMSEQGTGLYYYKMTFKKVGITLDFVHFHSFYYNTKCSKYIMIYTKAVTVPLVLD